MKKGTFYFFEKLPNQDDFIAVEKLVCEIVAERWRNGKRILIICENKQQAIHLDEALWTRPERSFIPHNVSEKGPKIGAPIEIDWLKAKKHIPRDTLINLCRKFPDFFTIFQEVIDFIPPEESLKKIARERYKAYRGAGFNLNIATWNNENNIRTT